MAARAARVMKLKCPQCGVESYVKVGEDELAAAAASPTGLVGVADYHGDHVLVVYVDSEGRDRGVRVFRALQRGEVVRVNAAFLSHMGSIAGFRVRSGGWSVECFAGNPRALLRVFRGELTLDVELKSFDLASKAVDWGDQFLAALQRVGQPDPGGLLLSILLLDAYIPELPSPFSRRAFEVAMKSGRLVVETDRSAAELLREYASRVPWLTARSVDFALSVDRLRLVEAVLGPDPVTVRKRLIVHIAKRVHGAALKSGKPIPYASVEVEAPEQVSRSSRLIEGVAGSDPFTIRKRMVMLLSLERRGVVRFVEVGA